MVKMKDKIIFIVLAIVFIGMMFLLNFVLQKENENIISDGTETSNIEQENSKVLKVTSNTFENEVLESHKTVLIDFYADWCGPCKVLSPTVEEIANENDDIKVVKINIDDEQNIASDHGIMSIPTLVVIKNGEESNRAIGVISKNEIEELIK